MSKFSLSPLNIVTKLHICTNETPILFPRRPCWRNYELGIQRKTLSDIERAGLLTDAYALVKAGHLSPEVLIKLLGHFKNEDSYIVWEGLASVLNGLDKVFV